MRQSLERASGVLLMGVLLAVPANGQTTSRAAAAKLENPVPASAASVSAGEQVYQKQCRLCHGATGQADSPVARRMNAPNLTDATWSRGSSDGEIFVVIQEGTGPDFKMKGFKGKISDQDTWHVVNYVRSLGAAKK